MQWEHGDFGLNAKHPPLAKFLATMPPLAMILTEPPLLDQPYPLQEVWGGKAFDFQNDANAVLIGNNFGSTPAIQNRSKHRVSSAPTSRISATARPYAKIMQ